MSPRGKATRAFAPTVTSCHGSGAPGAVRLTVAGSAPGLWTATTTGRSTVPAPTSAHCLAGCGAPVAAVRSLPACPRMSLTVVNEVGVVAERQADHATRRHRDLAEQGAAVGQRLADAHLHPG